jgi:hypothetical protein
VRSLTDRAAARVAAALWRVTVVVVAWGLVLPVVADLPRGTAALRPEGTQVWLRAASPRRPG